MGGTQVGKGFVEIVTDTAKLQSSISGLGSLLGGKFGALGSLLGSRLGKGIDSELGSSSSGVAELSQTLGKTGPWGLAVAGVVASAAVIGTALYKIGSDFDQAYRQIARATGDTGKSLGDLETAFKNVAKATPASFPDIVTALVEVQRYTGPAGKALDGLTLQFLTLSRITGTDVGSNVDAGVKALERWNLTAKQAPGAIDALFTASQKSGTSFSTLAQQVTTFAPQLGIMGFNFQQSTAMLASFDKTGVNSSRVMAAMQIAAAKIAKSHQDAQTAVDKDQTSIAKYTAALAAAKPGSADYKKAADDLALSHLKLAADQDTVAKAAKETVPQAFAAAVKSIRDAGSSTDALNIATSLFGSRGAVQMVQAIRSGKFNFDEMKSSIDKSNDSISDTANRTQTMSGAWGKFINNIKVDVQPAATAFFNGFKKVSIDALNGLTVAVNWLSVNLPPMIAGIGRVFATLGPTIKTTWDVAKPVFKAIGDAFATVSDLIHGNWKKAWDDFGAFMRAGLDTLKKLPDALFQGVTLPFRIMAASLGSTGSDIAKSISNIPSSMGGVFSQILTSVETAMAGFWSYVSAIPTNVLGDLAALGGTVAGAMSSGFSQAIGGAIGGIAGLWGWVGSIAGSVGATLANVGASVFGAMAGGFAQAVGGAGAGIAALWGWITGVAGQVGSTLASVGTSVFFAFAGGFAQAVNGASSGLSNMWSWLTNLGHNIISGLGDIGTQLYNAAAHAFGRFADGIRSAAGDIASAAKGVFGTVFSYIPLSPAKEGPFARSGWNDLYRGGQAVVNQFSAGISAAAPNVTAALTPVLTPGITGTPVMTGSNSSANNNNYGGPSVVVENATFSDKLDIEQFMRQAAWVVQTRGI